MRLPKPAAGLVIRYNYLWYREYLVGREEGAKDRPCALVAAVAAEESGKLRVLVIPITHSPPNDSIAIEIPRVIKQRLRLDADRSWIVLSEWNEFSWAGPDLRRVPHSESVAYGFLPPGFFATIGQRFFDLGSRGLARRILRSE